MDEEEIINNFINDVEKLYKVSVDGEDGFGTEFQKIKKQSSLLKQNPTYKSTAGEQIENKKRNRYKDILPFDYTRVELPNKDENNYINASFIKGTNGLKSYIASQGPLPHTVNDFWRMLWSYRVKVIIMVCHLTEGKKQKCERYWPATNTTGAVLTFDDITVSLDHEEYHENVYCTRTLCVKKDGEIRRITQLHYLAWPDHGLPRTRNEILRVIEEARALQRYTEDQEMPLCVHCSAGCGRTGVVLVIDYFRDLLHHKRLNPNLRVFDVITEMRKQRPAIVQTKDQYEFVHLAVSAMFSTYLTSKGKLLSAGLTQSLTNTAYENIDLQRNIRNRDSKTEKPSSTVKGSYENVTVDSKPLSSSKLTIVQPNSYDQTSEHLSPPPKPNRAPPLPRPVSSYDAFDPGWSSAASSSHTYCNTPAVTRNHSDPKPATRPSPALRSYQVKQDKSAQDTVKASPNPRQKPSFLTEKTVASHGNPSAENYVKPDQSLTSIGTPKQPAPLKPKRTFRKQKNPYQTNNNAAENVTDVHQNTTYEMAGDVNKTDYVGSRPKGSTALPRQLDHMNIHDNAPRLPSRPGTDHPPIPERTPESEMLVPAGYIPNSAASTSKYEDIKPEVASSNSNERRVSGASNIPAVRKVKGFFDKTTTALNALHSNFTSNLTTNSYGKDDNQQVKSSYVHEPVMYRNQDISFGYRINRKPKGRRPKPSNWTK